LGAQETFADAEFTCTSAQVSNSRLKAGVPVWRYRFFGGGPVEPGASSLSVQAAHGSELSYVFGGIQSSNTFSRPSAQKTAVSQEMMTVWAAFAKDPAKGPLQHGWPLYDPKGMMDFSDAKEFAHKYQAIRWFGSTTRRKPNTVWSAATNTTANALLISARTRKTTRSQERGLATLADWASWGIWGTLGIFLRLLGSCWASSKAQRALLQVS
jgi:Carboxylesterase family